MDGIEEKLSVLFRSPESMEQIRKLAESLSGAEKAEQGGGSDDRASGETGTDSGLTQTVLDMIQAGNTPNETTKLVHALKPWLNPQRADRLEKAVRIARLTTVAKNILPNLSANIR